MTYRDDVYNISASCIQPWFQLLHCQAVLYNTLSSHNLQYTLIIWFTCYGVCLGFLLQLELCIHFVMEHQTVDKVAKPGSTQPVKRVNCIALSLPQQQNSFWTTSLEMKLSGLSSCWLWNTHGFAAMMALQSVSSAWNPCHKELRPWFNCLSFR